MKRLLRLIKWRAIFGPGSIILEALVIRKGTLRIIYSVFDIGPRHDLRLKGYGQTT